MLHLLAVPALSLLAHLIQNSEKEYRIEQQAEKATEEATRSTNFLKQQATKVLEKDLARIQQEHSCHINEALKQLQQCKVNQENSLLTTHREIQKEPRSGFYKERIFSEEALQPLIQDQNKILKKSLSLLHKTFSQKKDRLIQNICFRTETKKQETQYYYRCAISDIEDALEKTIEEIKKNCASALENLAPVKITVGIQFSDTGAASIAAVFGSLPINHFYTPTHNGEKKDYFKNFFPGSTKPFNHLAAEKNTPFFSALKQLHLQHTTALEKTIDTIPSTILNSSKLHNTFVHNAAKQSLLGLSSALAHYTWHQTNKGLKRSNSLKPLNHFLRVKGLSMFWALNYAQQASKQQQDEAIDLLTRSVSDTLFESSLPVQLKITWLFTKVVDGILYNKETLNILQQQNKESLDTVKQLEQNENAPTQSAQAWREIAQNQANAAALIETFHILRNIPGKIGGQVKQSFFEKSQPTVNHKPAYQPKR